MQNNQNSLYGFHCPRWAQLPSLPLYMDQVILVIQQAAGPFCDENERVLTASMVNNYVKQGLIPPPQKKRYTNDHLARLIVVTLLKRVLSMNEIAQIMEVLSQNSSMPQGYDWFASKLEQMLAQAFDNERQILGPVEMTGEALDVVNAALAALMGKLLVHSLLPQPVVAAPPAPTKEKKNNKERQAAEE